MYKKFTVFFAASLFATFILTSCGGNDSAATDEGTTEVTDETTASDENTTAEEPIMDLSAGAEIYNGKGMCFTCHQPAGEGLAPSFPPLANADYLLADKERAIHQTLHGSDSPITVNGVEYLGKIMGATISKIEFTDQEVADVVNYILNSWGNNGGTVTVEDVARVRAAN